MGGNETTAYKNIWEGINILGGKVKNKVSKGFVA